MNNVFKFVNVYKKVSSGDESIRYEKINENITMNVDTVESLIRGSFAIIKYTEKGADLYYNV